MRKMMVMAVLLAASNGFCAIAPKMVVRMDKDKDGKITRDEYVGLFAAIFDRKDKNRDSKLDATEYTHSPSFKSGDRDKDGVLTREEFVAIYERQFDTIHDKNKDGVVTSDEM